MANIQMSSWLYWVHACIVWLVVVAVQGWLHQATKEFPPRRWRSLKTMPAPRANTVLVENLSAEYCSDARAQAAHPLG